MLSAGTFASEPSNVILTFSSAFFCLSLKIGRFFSYYLKGSVIPFICISDAKKVINKALQNNQEQQWQIKVEKLKKINAFEENLKQQLSTISQLKIALLRS